MRRIIISTVVFACLPLAAHAQNYLPASGYNGAGVVVNMDVLNTPAPSLGAAPVMSQNLPPVAPPIRMRPPVPMAPPMMAPPAQAMPSSAEMAPVSPAETESTSAPSPKYISPFAPDAVTDTAPPSGFSAGRQVLGSLHDKADDDSSSSALPSPPPPIAPAPVDEMAPLASPPAMPSPIMGSTESIKAPAATIATASDSFEAYRLFFDPSSDVLKSSETSVLDKVAAKLNADSSLRLQVRAYAAANADNAGAARRLSLSRSLKVRDYLTQKNIAATRLDVRALGSGSMEMGDQASSKAPADRVDVIFSK
jgi:outer membrane protein OmpA-like peptidoglycan-associated protein